MGARKESYEDMMAKLENIVSSMDQGDTSLEETMKNYEEGIKLCNKLYKILNDVEGKIKVLTDEGELDFIKGEE
ncbi:MAG: exodeoxyribonuclease VII small subunit [Bacillota bacterium]|nr:exodeoxyribonuclease VII small subunit [Bacillota bacterium]